jgi:MOSC domain-containing protein YiiM
MAHVLEVRAGAPLPVEDMLQKVPQWQIKDYSSGYIKTPVSGAVAVHFNGIEGNMAGYEGHVRDILDRAVLVFYEPIYNQLQEKFPDAMKTLKRGGFGENIVVDHPSLSPEEVCIGDVYQIGTVRLVVTAPRQPCPKVDVYHNVKGLTEYTKQHCKAGNTCVVSE